MQNLLNTNSFLTKISVQEASVGKFICPKCPGFFTNLKTEYERHLCENHGIYDKISCIYCSYNFDFNKISSHIESHFDENLMSTNICNLCHEFVKMDCQESVLDHLMFYHNNEFICPICKFIYDQEYDLVEHINDNLRIVYHCSFENCLVKTSSKEDFEFHVNSSNHQRDRNFEEHIFNCLNGNYEENNVKFSDESFLNSLFSNDNSDEKIEDKITNSEKKFDYILKLNFKKELFNREFKNLNSKMSLYLRKKLPLVNQFYVGVNVIKSKKLFVCSKCDHSTPYGHADTRKHILINHCQIKSLYVSQCLRTVQFTHHVDFSSSDINNNANVYENPIEFPASSVNIKTLSNRLISDDDLSIDKCNYNSKVMPDDHIISNRLISDDNLSVDKRNINCPIKSDELTISNPLNSEDKRNINYPIKLRFSKDKFKIVLKNLNTQLSIDIQRKLRSIHRYSVEVSLIQGKKLFFCSECNYVSHHHHTDVRKHIIVIHCGVSCIYLHNCLKVVEVFDEGSFKRKPNFADLKTKKTKFLASIEEKRTTRSSIYGGLLEKNDESVRNKDLSIQKEGGTKKKLLVESEENKENSCQDTGGVESRNKGVERIRNQRRNVAVKVARKVLQTRNQTDQMSYKQIIKQKQPSKILASPQISNNETLVRMNYSEKVFKRYFQNIGPEALKSLKDKMDNFKNFSMMISVLNNSKIFLCVDCGFKSSHNPGTTKKHIMTKHCEIDQIYLKDCLKFCISSPDSNFGPLSLKEKIEIPVETLDLVEQENISLNKKRQSSIKRQAKKIINSVKNGKRRSSLLDQKLLSNKTSQPLKSLDQENISPSPKIQLRKTKLVKEVEIPVKSRTGRSSLPNKVIFTNPESIPLVKKRQSLTKKNEINIENTSKNSKPDLFPNEAQTSLESIVQENVPLNRKKLSHKIKPEKNVEIPVKSRKRKSSVPEQEISFSEAKQFFESIGRESLPQNQKQQSPVSKEETSVVNPVKKMSRRKLSLPSQEVVPLKRKRQSLKDKLENTESLSNEARQSLEFINQEEKEIGKSLKSSPLDPQSLSSTPLQSLELSGRENVYRKKKIQSSAETGKIVRKRSFYPDQELFPNEEKKFLEFSLPESFSQSGTEKIEDLLNADQRKSFPDLEFISNNATKSLELSGQKNVHQTKRNRASFKKEKEDLTKTFRKRFSFTVDEMFSNGDEESLELHSKKIRPSFDKERIKVQNPAKPCQRSSFSVEELLGDEVSFVDQENGKSSKKEPRFLVKSDWEIVEPNHETVSLALVRSAPRPSDARKSIDREIRLDYSETILEALFKTENISDRFAKVKEKMEIYRQTTVRTGRGTGRGPVYQCSRCQLSRFQSAYDVSRHVVADHTGIGDCLVGLVMISAQLDNADRLMSDEEISELGWKGRPILPGETARFSIDISNY